MLRASRLSLYAFTVFLSSALLMVLEITAGRLLAPYIGVSIYSWTSIIGVILAGLSLGNWLGGVWADRGATEKFTGVILGLAGVTSLATLLILTLIAPILHAAQLNLLSASFLYVLCLFFVPALMIGIITPLLTTLAVQQHPRTGHVIGMMHALAALGSIVGTFATGYWLIQYFGTQIVITTTAIILLLMSLPFLYSRHVQTVFVLLAVSLGIAETIHARQGFASPCDKESQYFCIRVVDASSDVPFGSATAMVLDHLLHGINHKQRPDLLVSPYIHAMDELLRNHLGDRYSQGRYFFAGGGSYTHPRALRNLAPMADITIAEIDPAVTDMAEKKMFFDGRQHEVLHMDARLALSNMPPASLDAVIGDVFHDIALPYHLVTREYTRLIKQRLHHNGIYVLNVVDAYPDPKLVKSIYKTLAGEFEHVHIWLQQLPQQPSRMTYVISASDRDMPETVEAQHGIIRRWQKVTRQVIDSHTPLLALPVLTDDFVPVERLIARLLTTELGLH